MPKGSGGYHISPMQIEQIPACYTETRMPFF